jgi:electron transfer flavoprotein beta subunit
MNDAEIIILTMGPPRAAEIIREAMYSGADQDIWLPTANLPVLIRWPLLMPFRLAVKKLQPHLVIAGRQAIDGDTAQVGPQVAEKLNIPRLPIVKKSWI